MQRGFAYLAAVMDWATRRVLAWRISNTLTADFCVEAVEEAIARYGKPEIFNTDQGTQFTSDAFTGMLHGHNISISMDGRGCWRDNVFVERLWRSINTKRSICTPRTASVPPKRVLDAILLFTMADARTPRSAIEPLTRHTSPNKP